MRRPAFRFDTVPRLTVIPFRCKPADDVKASVHTTVWTGLTTIRAEKADAFASPDQRARLGSWYHVRASAVVQSCLQFQIKSPGQDFVRLTEISLLPAGPPDHILIRIEFNPAHYMHPD